VANPSIDSGTLMVSSMSSMATSSSPVLFLFSGRNDPSEASWNTISALTIVWVPCEMSSSSRSTGGSNASSTCCIATSFLLSSAILSSISELGTALPNVLLYWNLSAGFMIGSLISYSLFRSSRVVLAYLPHDLFIRSSSLPY